MKKISTYPTKKQFADMLQNIATHDTEANKLFGMDKFDIKFNHNFRWFWARSVTFYNFELFAKLHLE